MYRDELLNAPGAMQRAKTGIPAVFGVLSLEDE